MILQWRISGVGSIHLTLWSIVIEHSIVQHCGSGANQSRKTISHGETNFLSQTYCPCVSKVVPRDSTCCWHIPEIIYFSHFFFFFFNLFFKLAEAGERVKYLNSKRGNFMKKMLIREARQLKKGKNAKPAWAIPLPLEHCAVHVWTNNQCICKKMIIYLAALSGDWKWNSSVELIRNLYLGLLSSPQNWDGRSLEHGAVR